jgi:hypothetical protein
MRMMVSLVALCLTAISAPVPAARLHLFVDDSLVETSRGVALTLHPPEGRQEVFRFDAPWEGGESGYVTVLRDGDVLRLYYRGGGEETTREVTCMATSSDGVNWLRPDLGLFEFNGSKANNIVWTAPNRKSYGGSHNFTPFIDANPAADPGARYKAVGLGIKMTPEGDDVRALAVFASPDGIRWRSLAEKAAITTGSFDSQNVAFWDARRGCYACYLRHGRDGLRSIMLTTSTDFLQWTEPQWLQFRPGQDEHFYTNAIEPYFRETSLYIGFPMRFVPQRKSVGDPPRQTDGVSDAVFISSRDGIRFDRVFREAFIRPGPDPCNWGKAHSNQTPAWGIVPVSPEQIAVYWSDSACSVPVLRRGLLRTDGFASVRAGFGGGEFVTVPMKVEGASLAMNFATSAVGGVRVEVRDDAGAPVPGYGLDDCPVVFGDEMGRIVRWTGGRDLAPLAGRTIRLRFVMNDADLYSLRFCD